MGYLFVFLTILLTVYGQLVIKWQVNAAGVFPAEPPEQAAFLLRLLLNPWVISGLAAAFAAALAWMGALAKLDLSHAYPFMSLAFVLVVLASGWLFAEPVGAVKLAGLALIVAGIVVGSQG